MAWEQYAIKFAKGKKLTYKKPENLPSYIGVRALVYADTTPPAAQQDIQRLSALVRAQQITIDKLEAQRQWVGLTNDEIALIHADNPHPQGFARAVLAKSKEKNT